VERGRKIVLPKIDQSQFLFWRGFEKKSIRSGFAEKKEEDLRWKGFYFYKKYNSNNNNNKQNEFYLYKQ